MDNTTFKIGYFSMLLYVVFTAFAAICIHQTNQQTEPLLAAFYTFLCCLLVYHGMTMRNPVNLTKLKNHFSTICMLNLTTMLCWVLSFIALKYIPPDLYLFIYLCAMPITASILYKTKAIQAAILLSGIVVLATTYQSPSILPGFVLAFIGGAFGTIYSIFSKRIANQFSVMRILALRFYLTVLVTGFISYYSGSLHWMSASFYLQFGLLSIIAVIIPLLLFQIGLKTLPITKTLSFLPLAPLCCYSISHFILSHGDINVVQLFSVGLLSVGMVL